MTKCFTIKTGKVVCQGSKGAKKNYDDSKVKISNRKGTGRKKPREQRTARAKLTTSELKALLRRNGYTARQLEGKTKVELLKLPPTRRLKDIKDKERTGRAMGVSRSRFKEKPKPKVIRGYRPPQIKKDNKYYDVRQKTSYNRNFILSRIKFNGETATLVDNDKYGEGNLQWKAGKKIKGRITKQGDQFFLKGRVIILPNSTDKLGKITINTPKPKAKPKAKAYKGMFDFDSD